MNNPQGQRQLPATAKAHLALQQQAAASHAYRSDPHLWWQQLLIEERQLQEREAFMTVENIKWSTAAWADLHDRSESLARRIALCIGLLKQQGDR